MRYRANRILVISLFVLILIWLFCLGKLTEDYGSPSYHRFILFLVWLIASIPFIFLLIIGVRFYLKSFASLRRKRLVEDLPTSTVRGLAMGIVELVGRAKTRKNVNLKSPFSQTDCVFYHYKVERIIEGKSVREPVTIAEGDSSHCSFYLDDGTGGVQVLPEGAQLILPASFTRQVRSNRDLSVGMKEFIPRGTIWGFGEPIRFTEWCIKPEQTIYVLGKALKSPQLIEEHNKELARRLKELKDNPAEMSEIDLDKDGQISAYEWNLALAKIEQEVIQQQLQAQQSDELADVVVARADEENLFIISDHSQKETIKNLARKTMGIFIGIVLGTLALPLLLYILWWALRIKP